MKIERTNFLFWCFMDLHIWLNIIIRSNNLRAREVCKYWYSLIKAYEKKILSMTILEITTITQNIFFLDTYVRHRSVWEWTEIFDKLRPYDTDYSALYYKTLIAKNNLLYYPQIIEQLVEKCDFHSLKHLIDIYFKYMNEKAIQIYKFIIECIFLYHTVDILWRFDSIFDIPKCRFYHYGDNDTCVSLICILRNLKRIDDPIMKASIRGTHYMDNTKWLNRNFNLSPGKWALSYAYDYNRMDLVPFLQRIIL